MLWPGGRPGSRGRLWREPHCSVWIGPVAGRLACPAVQATGRGLPQATHGGRERRLRRRLRSTHGCQATASQGGAQAVAGASHEGAQAAAGRLAPVEGENMGAKQLGPLLRLREGGGRFGIGPNWLGCGAPVCSGSSGAGRVVDCVGGVAGWRRQALIGALCAFCPAQWALCFWWPEPVGSSDPSRIGNGSAGAAWCGCSRGRAGRSWLEAGGSEPPGCVGRWTELGRHAGRPGTEPSLRPPGGYKPA